MFKQPTLFDEGMSFQGEWVKVVNTHALREARASHNPNVQRCPPALPRVGTVLKVVGEGIYQSRGFANNAPSLKTVVAGFGKQTGRRLTIPMSCVKLIQR